MMFSHFAGSHKGSKCFYLAEAWSAGQAECKALWEAMQRARKLEMENVHFELDSKVVADAVNCESFSKWRIYNLILEIKSILRVFTSWQCFYVPKERNKVADILSKFARVEG